MAEAAWQEEAKNRSFGERQNNEWVKEEVLQQQVEAICLTNPRDSFKTIMICTTIPTSPWTICIRMGICLGFRRSVVCRPVPSSLMASKQTKRWPEQELGQTGGASA